MTDPLDAAEAYLTKVGLINCSGAVLYSSAATLKPGPVYVLGLNPGGDEGPSLAFNIEASRKGHNAYLDEQWAPGGNVAAKGKAPLQVRMQHLCELIGLDIRDVPASNLAFTRSTGIDTHDGFAAAVKLCLPVHRIFMDAIQPMFLFTFGNLSHFTEGLDVKEVESRAAQHGNMQVHRGRAVAFGHEVSFGNVPHMSRWASNYRTDILKWVVGDLL